MEPSSRRVIVIGAGIAGLCCARTLIEAGMSVSVLDASDDVGGRVRTDVVDGFRLDRGFQVYLTAYPEGRRFLDLEALDLRTFETGALIRLPDRPGWHPLYDALRAPSEAFGTLLSPAATLLDKLRTARLKADVRKGSPDELLARPQRTTIERLRAAGFSGRVIESFFRPFFGGVFLESALTTSSRAFDYTFRMFADGAAAVPALGMGEIPRQLASCLPAGCVRLDTRVVNVTHRLVTTEAGESLLAGAVVLATDGDAAMRLVPEHVRPVARWTGTTCCYFDAKQSPFGRPAICLAADGGGPINNVVALSDASDRYAPSGRALMSVNLIGVDHGDDATVEQNVRGHLVGLFGNEEVDNWRLLRIYRIPCALPDQSIAAMADVRKPMRLRPGLYVAGDHVDQASINGAMCAGRRAAEAVIADLPSG